MSLEEILDEILVPKDKLKEILEDYQPIRTKALKSKKIEPELTKCPRCVGELKLTSQGWYKCQRCFRSYFLKFP